MYRADDDFTPRPNSISGQRDTHIYPAGSYDDDDDGLLDLRGQTWLARDILYRTGQGMTQVCMTTTEIGERTRADLSCHHPHTCLCFDVVGIETLRRVVMDKSIDWRGSRKAR